MTYSEKLKDPRWQKRRLEILERDNWTCRECGVKNKTLNVHHRWYAKRVDIWDAEDACLVALCDDCHQWEHYNVDAARDFTERFYRNGNTPEELWRVLWAVSSVQAAEKCSMEDVRILLHWLCGEDQTTGELRVSRVRDCMRARQSNV